MKIVIISRTLFPFNAPRSMRTTNLSIELSRQGHQVTVYAVLGSYDYKDFEKKYQVRVKNLGPTSFAKLNSDLNQAEPSLLNKIMTRILHKPLEFPDIELMFKTYSALKKEKDVDVLITVATPFPIHWGAALYKRNCLKMFPKKWVADCGDPYMGNEFNKHPFYFKYIEKWFCKKTDYISIPVQKAVKAYYPEFHEKIKIIPQGFDFTLDNDQPAPNNVKPTFLYAGGFDPKFRDPRPFLDYLAKKNIDFKFILYTGSKELIEPYKKQFQDKLEVKDYIPRDRLLQEMKKADFLVNIENISNVQTPSKLIDYAIAGRPILSISQNEIDYAVVDEFLNKNYGQQFEVKNIMQYHIRHVAQEFIKLT